MITIPLPDPSMPPVPAQGPRTLGIDIGGSHLKAGLVSAQGTLIGDPIRVDTPHPATPAAVLAALQAATSGLRPIDRIAAGFPGMVSGGVVRTAPNLGTSVWAGVHLADQLSQSFGVPARIGNDATVQGFGVIAGRGLECVVTLGTGMGFALFLNGTALPHLELSQHPVHGHKTYDLYIGNAERKRIGDKRWNRRVRKIISLLRTVIGFDTLLIGGGNGKYLQVDLPPDVHIVPNQAGITGGIGLWKESGPESASPRP